MTIDNLQGKFGQEIDFLQAWIYPACLRPGKIYIVGGVDMIWTNAAFKLAYTQGALGETSTISKYILTLPCHLSFANNPALIIHHIRHHDHDDREYFASIPGERSIPWREENPLSLKADPTMPSPQPKSRMLTMTMMIAVPTMTMMMRIKSSLV